MRKEIGKYLLDVSKLVFGGVALSTILEVEDFSKVKMLLAGLIITLLLAILGFILLINKK